MADYSVDVRKKHFAKNSLAWTALRHFLPARMVRELVSATVDQITNGRLGVSGLFEDVVTSGPEWLDSWLLQPREARTPLESYLQFHIRAIAWQNDAEIHVPPDIQVPSGAINPKAVDSAVRLGAADFTLPERLLNSLRSSDQESYVILVEAITQCGRNLRSSTPNEFVAAIVPPVTSIEGPLATIIMKHLGDLCADADDWDKALAMYDVADSQLSEGVDSIWDELTPCLRTIITQSRGSAIWILSGATAAADFFSKAITAAPKTESTFLIANVSHDAMVASLKAHNSSRSPDRRAAVLLPPLLQATHDSAAALQCSLKGEFQNSHRQFWAVLRRQIALGLATESRVTKALYAQSILDGLLADIERNRQPDQFRMAIRLLLESGDASAAARTIWNEDLVHSYVDENCVEFVIKHSEQHLGARTERRRVVLELFQHWIDAIALDRVHVADVMLKHVLSLAINGPISLLKSENLGGRSLEVVHHLAETRPELRSGIASHVADAITNRLSSPELWTAQTTALEIANEYGDVFSQEQLQTIVLVALDLLAGIDPRTDAWPVTRPALTFLSSTAVKRFSESVPDIGKRILDSILVFGVQQNSEHARVLFYLYDFDSNLLRDPSIAEKLRSPVVQVRHRALQSRSSDAVENIQALLIAPAISGRDGVHDALAGLAGILKSATEPRFSIALSQAYASLLLLANQHARIAEELSLPLQEFGSWLQPLVPLVADLWNRAKDRPLLFAPFSLPPAEVPNPVIVHNWAFASMVFGESLHHSDRILAALTDAMAQPLLRDSIALARATRSVAEQSVAINPEDIRKENRETFYAALGRRLVVLQRLDDDSGREVCSALLDQCFRHGPRDLDAAVLVWAQRLGLDASMIEGAYSEYIKRMGTNRDLRLALIPLLEMFGVRL